MKNRNERMSGTAVLLLFSLLCIFGGASDAVKYSLDLSFPEILVVFALLIAVTLPLTYWLGKHGYVDFKGTGSGKETESIAEKNYTAGFTVKTTAFLCLLLIALLAISVTVAHFEDFSDDGFMAAVGLAFALWGICVILCRVWQLNTEKTA